MKISVVIPAYNEEERIGKALGALLAQDYHDFEVIVVDNASTDRTADIARSFPGVKVIREERKGTNPARERGRKEALGEIVATMDADCIPGREWLRRGAALFEDSRVSGATGPYYYYDGPFWERYFSMYFQICFYWPFESILQMLGKGAIMIGGNSFMRASAFEKIGGFNTSFAFWGDDTDTAMRLSKVGRVVFSPGLILRTSARRFKAEGFFKLSNEYFFYCFRTLFPPKKG